MSEQNGNIQSMREILRDLQKDSAETKQALFAHISETKIHRQYQKELNGKTDSRIEKIETRVEIHEKEHNKEKWITRLISAIFGIGGGVGGHTVAG